jgi:hypothetical protein
MRILLAVASLWLIVFLGVPTVLALVGIFTIIR